jgi:hypothetical protein
MNETISKIKNGQYKTNRCFLKTKIGYIRATKKINKPHTPKARLMVKN